MHLAIKYINFSTRYSTRKGLVFVQSPRSYRISGMSADARKAATMIKVNQISFMAAVKVLFIELSGISKKGACYVAKVEPYKQPGMARGSGPCQGVV